MKIIFDKGLRKISRGYFGCARYKEELDNRLIYEYSGENWNLPHDVGDYKLYDGLVCIERSLFEEEYWGDGIEEGRIKVIKECKNAFYLYDTKIDYIAIRIISQILNEYKKNGEIPMEVTFIQ